MIPEPNFLVFTSHPRAYSSPSAPVDTAPPTVVASPWNSPLAPWNKVNWYIIKESINPKKLFSFGNPYKDCRIPSHFFVHFLVKLTTYCVITVLSHTGRVIGWNGWYKSTNSVPPVWCYPADLGSTCDVGTALPRSPCPAAGTGIAASPRCQAHLGPWRQDGWRPSKRS